MAIRPNVWSPVLFVDVDLILSKDGVGFVNEGKVRPPNDGSVEITSLGADCVHCAQKLGLLIMFMGSLITHKKSRN